LRWGWPTFRALLIGASLVLGGIDGLPITRAEASAKLPRPLRWARESLREVRAAILAPLSFVSEGLRVQQRWELFTSSREERFRLWIEARATDDEPWRLLYRAHDPEHALFAPVLQYRRVRASWNPSRRGARAGYPWFVTWVARRVFEGDPRLQTVRVQAEQIRLDPRGPGFVGTGTYAHTEHRARAEVLK